MIEHGDQNTAVNNAVIDFLHGDRLSKKDTRFSIHVLDISDGVLGIWIIGTDQKVLPGPDDKIGTNHPGFPTRYIVQDGKLFLWYDSTFNITNDLIGVLSKHSFIDSVNVNGFVGIPPYSNNDRKEAADYYFCKGNFRKYKKIHSSIAMSRRAPPKFVCNFKSK